MKLYLKEDAKIEPLCGRWYAWHHLVAPLQRGFQILNRHTPLLKSFMANPSIHQEAARDPELMCGPVVDLSPADVEAVDALMQETLVRTAPLTNLAQDFRAFETRLCTSATGHSLDNWYSQLPPSLAGLVELSYDHRNLPRMSVRETLLYRLKSANVFQEIYVHRTEDTKRKFFLNTPRLTPGHGEVMLSWPFDDERLDILSRLRVCGVDAEELAAELPELSPAAVQEHLLMPTPPVRYKTTITGNEVRVRYFGHACAMVQSREVSVLIDPVMAHQRDGILATLTFNDLPDFIDYIVISHGHQDHFCFESLLQLRKRVGVVLVPKNTRGAPSDPSMRLALMAVGISNVLELEDMDRIDIPGGHILSVPFPGEHCDLDVKTRQCMAISLLGRKFVFLVDSDAVDSSLYERVRAEVHDVDAMFIGMECQGAPLSWLYGPLLAAPVPRKDDESRRGKGSNCERAVKVVKEIGCSSVYVYAMGMEPWNQHLLGLDYSPGSYQIVESDRFIAGCIREGISAERLKGTRDFLY